MATRLDAARGPGFGDRESARMERLVEKYLALRRRNRDLQAMIDRLEVKARTDPLTGLANRRWFHLLLHGFWAEARQRDLPLACLMIDLDDFKALNDQAGHQHGDAILRLAARIIRENCRAGDLTARYGGDEFCVVMPDTEPDEAVGVANRLVRAFEQETGGFPTYERHTGMSVGLAHNRVSDPADADDLLAQADEALYAAKAAGGSRVVVRPAARATRCQSSQSDGCGPRSPGSPAADAPP